jgi:hypothetical protein
MRSGIMADEYMPFDRAFAAEYSLQVEVGHADAPDGVTRVQVDGSGNIEAAQLRNEPGGTGARDRDETGTKGERDEGSNQVKGRMSPDEALYLFDQASLAPWGRRFPQRPGIPDEAIVEVRLRRERRDSASVKLWLREAEKDPALGPMLKLLRKHLTELSGGRIYL